MDVAFTAESDASGGEDEVERADGYRFRPPLYVQRYRWAIDQLRDCDDADDMRHVVDMGCAEGKFLARARFSLKAADTLTGVDILAECCASAATTLRDQRDEPFFLDRRHKPLTVQVMKGSIDEFDARLSNVDAVTLIEVIEHVHLDQLARITANVFGRMRPRRVLVSTPNKEFNVVFGLADAQTRHWDHKFEWTRAQFDECVVIDGCGAIIPPDPLFAHPKHDAHYDQYACVGPASQTAVFTLDGDVFKRERNAGRAHEEEINCPYEMCLSLTYPCDADDTHRSVIRRLVMDTCNAMIDEHQRCVAEHTALESQTSVAGSAPSSSSGCVSESDESAHYIENVSGHPHVYYFDARRTVDECLGGHPDLRAFVDTVAHILHILLDDRRFDNGANARAYTSFADALDGHVFVEHGIDRSHQFVYPTTAYGYVAGRDDRWTPGSERNSSTPSIASSRTWSSVSITSDDDDFEQAALYDNSETQWPQGALWEDAPSSPVKRSSYYARRGEFFTRFADVEHASGPFVMCGYEEIITDVPPLLPRVDELGIVRPANSAESVW